MTWQLDTPNGFASYLDGELVTNRPSSDTPIPNMGVPVYFGHFTGDPEPTKGMLSDIAIWNLALTPPKS